MKKNVFTLSDVSLKEGDTKSQVEVLRTGVIRDRDWRITDEMLDMYVANFKSNVYGTEIQVNLEHNRGGEAAGWVKDLYKDGHSLFCEVEWTEMGAEKITKKLFKFVSAELALEYPDCETGEICQNVFIGLALTNTPALKGQKALALSEIQELNNTLMLKKFIELLTARPFVSKEEKETMRALLSEASEEEKIEVEAGSAEVEAKPEAPEPTEEELAKKKKEEEEAAATKAAEEAAAAEAAAKAETEEKAKEGEQLSEMQLAEKAKITALEEENRTLKQEKLRNELEKNVAPFMLSEKQKTGFVEANSKSKLVDFLASLSEENRKVALSLFAEILRVELGEKGDVGAQIPEGDDEEKALKDQKMRAELMAKEKGILLHEALSIVISADAQKAEAKV